MTIVNNNYIRYSKSSNDKYINIPLQITFDNEGREDAIRQYEKEVLKSVLNSIDDFETTKFANAPYQKRPNITEINYEFLFYDHLNDALTATTTSWVNTYKNPGFTNNEIYYFANSFKNSFFKLDFYDTKSSENQRLYFTIVIPTQQGLTIPGNIGVKVVNLKKPYFKLDYVGADKEGFFYYWLKNTSYINQTTFYMSCKFFNAKKGQFVRMMNEPQSSFVGGGAYNFDKELFFYYKVDFDYNNYEYKVYKESPALTRKGEGPLATEAIMWYEYVNP